MERGKNLQVLCKEVADFIKNLILIKAGVGDFTVLDILPGEFSSYSEMANRFDIDYLKMAFSKFAQIELDLKYSLNPENLFEKACLDLMRMSSETNVQVKVQQTQVQNEVKPISNNDAPVKLEIEQTEIEKVWGSVLIKVKENNMFALSNALTTVNKVEKIEWVQVESLDETERAGGFGSTGTK